MVIGLKATLLNRLGFDLNLLFAVALPHTPEDAPMIGLVLCKNRHRTDVEYALRGMTQPLGVSQFELSDVLPQELEWVPPTVAQLEAQLERLEPDE